MSRKNNLLKFHNIIDGDMSQASITSLITNIEFLDNIAVQLNFTGSPIGTFAVQVSIDHEEDFQGNVTVGGTWVSVALPSSPVAAGSDGSILIDLNQLASSWIRIVYTKTSGSGVLNSFISAKML